MVRAHRLPDASSRASWTPSTSSRPLASCLFFWARSFRFITFPSYGIAHGLDPVFANYLLVILNTGSFFGRVGSGELADRLGR